MTIRKYRIVKKWPYSQEQWRQIEKAENSRRAIERRERFSRQKEAAQEFNAHVTGRWFCPQCKNWHRTPAKPQLPKKSTAPDAVDQIELCLAQAAGQCWEYRYKLFVALADDINEWSIKYKMGSSSTGAVLKTPRPGLSHLPVR